MCNDGNPGSVQGRACRVVVCAAPRSRAAFLSLIAVLTLVFCVAGTTPGQNRNGVRQSRARRDAPDVRALQAEARRKAQDGLTAEAIVLYRRLANAAGTDTELLGEAARFLAGSSGAREEAERLFARLADLTPNDAPLAAARAANLSALGDSTRAALEYRRLFELTAEDEVALEGYVRHVTRLGAVSVAVEQLSKRLRDPGTEVATRLMLAAMLHADGRYNDALDQIATVQRRAPNNRLAARLAAESWLALGYYESAARIFVELATASGAAQVERLRAIAGQARVLLNMGRPNAALSLLQSSSAELTRSTLAPVAADCYRALERKTDERRVLEATLASNGEAPLPVIERLARVRFEAGDEEGARQAATLIVNRDANNSIGKLALTLTAGAQPTTSPTVNPTPADAPRQPADASEAVAPGKAAKEELTPIEQRRQVGRDRDLGEAALFWNQPALAIEHLRRAAETQPDSPRLRFALGAAFERAGDLSKAAEILAGVSLVYGDQPEAWRALAGVESARENVRRAIEIYRHALRLDESNFALLFGLAASLKATGGSDELEEAAALLTRLARLAPESPRVNSRLREALVALGRAPRTDDDKPPPPSLALASLGAPPLAAPPLPVTSDAIPAAPAAIKPLIGVGDRLRVRNLKSFSGDTIVEVDRTGMIRLPSIEEPINAKCLTESELAQEIGERIGAGGTARRVDVGIAEYGRAPLVVAGAVYLPGNFRVRSALTLQEGLRLASGSTPQAGRFIYVVRGSCEGRSEVAPSLGGVETYDLTAAQENGFPDVRRLRGGDTVFVPPGGSFIVVGGVKRPGLVQSGGSPTLANALASAGGVVPDAQLSRISVWRLMPGETAYRVYPVNLKEIEAGRAGQVIIRPGDIIEVPTRNETRVETRFAALLERIAFGTPPAGAAEIK